MIMIMLQYDAVLGKILAYCKHKNNFGLAPFLLYPNEPIILILTADI